MEAMVKKLLLICLIGTSLCLQIAHGNQLSIHFRGNDGLLPSDWEFSQASNRHGGGITEDMLHTAKLSYAIYTGKDGLLAPPYEIIWKFKITEELLLFADNCQHIFFGCDESRDPNEGPEAYSVGIRAFDLNRHLFLTISPQREGRYDSSYLKRIKLENGILDTDTVYTIKVKYEDLEIVATLYDGENEIASVTAFERVQPLEGRFGLYSVGRGVTDSIEIRSLQAD